MTKKAKAIKHLQELYDLTSKEVGLYEKLASHYKRKRNYYRLSKIALKNGEHEKSKIYFLKALSTKLKN